ncbi:hypothetical protein MWU59_12695 [Flavobacteriaceae bacterium F08102]|nr:hypothetical protein [Flavobacteriaceae bacterium F08102]
MKNTVILFIAIVCSIWPGTGQVVHVDTEDEAYISAIPREKVYINTNTQLLFVGEYLYFSFNCLEEQTSTPSTVSTMGYVDLINEDKKVLFRQKLRLNKGKAQGDIFIPVTLPSGNYKIIGYTKWMLNFNAYFSDDISIINPYQSNQQAILGERDFTEDVPTGELTSNHGLQIEIDGTTYGKRSKVTFNLRNTKRIKGELTVSVRHVSPIKSHVGVRPGEDMRDVVKVRRYKDQLILPELRGELISGKITAVHDSIFLGNISVSLSIPNQEGYIVKLSKTKSDGTFYFNVDEKYNTKSAVFQVVSDDKDRFAITFDSLVGPDLSDLKFNKFYISDELKDEILTRSIYTQIENSYFNLKPDSVIVNTPTYSFDHDNMVVYNLDDYTRFETIKETLVEVVNNVWAVKRKGRYEFRIRGLATSNEIVQDFGELKPLVLVDGVLVQDQDQLMEFDARKVQSIGVIREKYVFGFNVFDGILVIQTIEGNYQMRSNGQSIITKELFSPSLQKHYFVQRYDPTLKAKTERIPDFRNQLLWKPNVDISAEENNFSFYTSDISGDFTISIKGYTEDGIPVVVNHLFTVE